MTTQQPYVNFEPKGGNVVQITAGYTVYYNEEEGAYSCFIPGFNLYYGSPTFERITEKAEGMVRLFVETYLTNDTLNTDSVKAELVQLGFLNNAKPISEYEVRQQRRFPPNMRRIRNDKFASTISSNPAEGYSNKIENKEQTFLKMAS
jgi:hypothetical protein